MSGLADVEGALPSGGAFVKKKWEWEFLLTNICMIA